MAPPDTGDSSAGRMFNLPPVVVAFALCLIGIHLGLVIAGEEIERWAMLVFGFVPGQLVGTWRASLPGAQVWITEWGVLDHPGDPAGEVADYAIGTVSRLKNLYSGAVAAAVWYGWADTMHNGYGLVNPSDQPKQPLYDRFLKV